MNRREKILALCAAAGLGAILLYVGVHRLFLKPAEQLAQKLLKEQIRQGELAREGQQLQKYVGRYARLRDRTFDDNRRNASVLASTRINQLARAAGLGEGDYKVTAFTEQRLKDAGWELLCTIDADTTLDRMVNLLYLLDQDEHLHRIGSLTIRPLAADKRRVHLSLAYATPVLEEPAVEIAERPTTQPMELASLNDPQRAQYDSIIRRHLLLPYVPRARPVERPVEGPPPTQPPVVPPPPPPRPTEQGYDQLVVVGLPAIGEQAEVHVAPPGGQVKEPLKVGDQLASGKIAMVDYRHLPLPDNPKEISQSRVILKIEKDYWAVELGQRIGQRRVLRPSELPDQLKPAPPGPQRGDPGSALRQPGSPRQSGQLASSQPARPESADSGGGS